MKMYLHTIDGRPAGFSESDGQIVHALSNKRTKFCAKPVKTLAEIKKQQEITFEYRRKKGFDVEKGSYRYVVIEINEEEKQNS